jgi:hypothetical protein
MSLQNQECKKLCFFGLPLMPCRLFANLSRLCYMLVFGSRVEGFKGRSISVHAFNLVGQVQATWG